MIRTNRFASYPHEFKVEAVRLVRESGKSTREIASDLGVSVVSLNRWLKDPELGGTSGSSSSGSLDAEERAELRRLRREVRVLREEREILKKSRPAFNWSVQQFVEFISWRGIAQSFTWPAVQFRGCSIQLFLRQILHACAFGEVLPEQSVSVLVRTPLPWTAWISEEHAHAELRFRHGVRCSRKRVERLMRQLGLQGIHRRRNSRPGGPRNLHPIFDDLVLREFNADGPNQLWVAEAVLSERHRSVEMVS